MSSNHKKAQHIVNEVDYKLNLSLVGYENSELELLKNKLQEFLDLEVSTDELVDAEEAYLLEEDLEDDEEVNPLGLFDDSEEDEI